MSGLFTPPKYFKDVAFHKHTDRAIGWLELFYDLVYVATLIQIGNFLSDNLTLVGFGQFLVMMFVVWWSWGGETLYQNRYVADDIWHRLLVFIQIGGVAVMGLSVSGAFGDLYEQFTLGYVLVRILTILMYVRTYFSHPESRAYAKRYIVGFAGGIAIWLAALVLPAESHWVAWLVAIIVLGEAFVKVLDGVVVAEDRGDQLRRPVRSGQELPRHQAIAAHQHPCLVQRGVRIGAFHFVYRGSCTLYGADTTRWELIAGEVIVAFGGLVNSYSRLALVPAVHPVFGEG